MRVRFLLPAHSAAKGSLSASTLEKYFVYIIRCRDDSFYTGFTRNVTKRILEHNTSKRGAKSLKGKLPVKLVYSEVYDSINTALKREREIKSWSRKKKLALINLDSAPALMSAAKKRE